MHQPLRACTFAPTPQGLTYIPETDPELRAMLCRWGAAFPRALMCHLRKDSDLEQELQASGKFTMRFTRVSLDPVRAWR